MCFSDFLCFEGWWFEKYRSLQVFCEVFLNLGLSAFVWFHRNYHFYQGGRSQSRKLAQCHDHVTSNSHIIKSQQWSDLSPVMLTLLTRLRWCVTGFSTENLLVSPFVYCIVWKVITTRRQHSGIGELCCTLSRCHHLHKSFGIFQCGRFVSCLPFFKMYSVI